MQKNEKARRSVAALSAMLALSLGACATGQGSFLAGEPDGGGGSDAAGSDEGLTFETAAPGLLAASGTALLPGGRNAGAGSLLGGAGGSSSANAALSGVRPAAGGLTVTPQASIGVAGTLTSPTVGISTGVAPLGGVNATVGLTGGPLLAIGGGAPSVLGASVGGNLLGVPGAAGASVAGGLSPQGSTTNLLVGLTTPNATPVSRPLSTVPGAVPLNQLVPTLRPRGG